MRILLMSNSYYPSQLGGLEMAVHNLAGALRAAGHQVSVVTHSPSGRPSTEVEASGVMVYRLPFILPRPIWWLGYGSLVRSLRDTLLFPALAPASFLRLLGIIRRTDPDLVNLHYIGENAVYCLLARKILDFPLVTSIHGNDIERHFHRSRFAQWTTKTVLQMSDRVLSNSQALLEKAKEISPAIQGKSTVVGNGVYPGEFASPIAFSHPRRYILSVANFVLKKGLDVLIQAFATIHEQFPDVDLLMAGSGPEQKRCRHLAAELGIEQSVAFLGRVERSRIPSLLNGCEVFVLPSRKEPFGIAILEAMAAGKAIVATRVDGIPEIITDGENGILAEPQAEELAEAVSWLLAHDDLRMRLGQRAHKSLHHSFTWNAVSQKYITAYKSILSEA